MRLEVSWHAAELTILSVKLENIYLFIYLFFNLFIYPILHQIIIFREREGELSHTSPNVIGFAPLLALHTQHMFRNWDTLKTLCILTIYHC
jgi:hypothetical protein